MKKIYSVGKFDIYKLNQDEEVEKGCKYGLIEQERALRTENLDSIDFDFHEKSLRKAFERATQWS